VQMLGRKIEFTAEGVGRAFLRYDRQDQRLVVYLADVLHPIESESVGDKPVRSPWHNERWPASSIRSPGISSSARMRRSSPSPQQDGHQVREIGQELRVERLPIDPADDVEPKGCRRASASTWVSPWGFVCSAL